MTRRQVVTGATAAVAASPFVNVGRYRLFASSVFEYSDRAISLVNDFRRVLADIWVA